MCTACGIPAAPGPWTEAGAATAGDRFRARALQARHLDRILRPYGLTVADGGAVPGFQLARLTGEVVLVPDLSTLWSEAERMLGRPIDPLGNPYV
ncbi:MAG TPA: hypothetical protein VK146_00050 [Tabrizicola sp.]|nr:hypothetical protein [Tabrizicola sp.]